MSDLKTEVSNQLKEITKYCYDSAEGYSSAADNVREDHPDYASKWESRSNLRQAFAKQLDEKLRCIGESGEEGGSVSGAIHRALMKLKDVFTSTDLEAIVEECIRGEQHLLDSIDETLEDVTIDGSTKSLLINLRTHVSESISMLGHTSL